MKALVIALSLLAGQAHAVADNTVALWTLDNVLTDDSGNGYTLTMAGTVPFVTTPQPYQGTHQAGAFSAANYLQNAGARAALSGSTTYTIECYVNTSSLAAQQQFMSIGAAAGDSLVLAITTDGRAKFVTDDANVYQSAAGVIAINKNYYFAIVVAGTNLKIYCNEAGTTLTKVFDNTATSPAFPTGGDIYIGVYFPTKSFLPMANGFVDFVRFSNIARTDLPTSDALAVSTQLSPYILNSNSPRMMPLWWNK